MGEIIYLRNVAHPQCGDTGQFEIQYTDYLRQLYDTLKEPIVPNMTVGNAEGKISEYRRHIRLYRPECIPSGMVDELRRLFEDRKNIYRIYVLLACYPNDFIPHWLILIDFDGDRTTVFPAIIKTANRYINQGEPFEIMQADELVLKSALKCAAPIFHKLHIQN